jgi:hypothetical protein
MPVAVPHHTKSLTNAIEYVLYCGIGYLKWFRCGADPDPSARRLPGAQSQVSSTHCIRPATGHMQPKIEIIYALNDTQALTLRLSLSV